MDDQTLKTIANQLRKPSGEFAIQVGEKMNEGNVHINLNTIFSLNLNTGDKILEIGMGNGFFVKNLFDIHNTIKYTGCDFSEAMVDEANKINTLYVNSGNVDFFCADAKELPFADDSFDKVFSVNTLYFWDNKELILSEIHRVLKKKGQITIAIRPKSIMQYYPFVKFGFNMYTKDELVYLLSTNNFEVIEVLEKAEPEQEINGEKMAVETLLVNAIKQ